MESGNGGASSKGVLVPVTATSDAFLNSVLAPLKSSYLYEESKQSFRYKSAVLIKNPTLEEKYNTFRSKRREEGYSEEDLKESYGFLLFDDASKANALGETGVLTGNSTCTILGDPSKGVYISMFSDCLDLNRWYHGKSGYIAIIRLTKGRVNRVLENYTQNFTAPTEGFDCHVSEQLPSVSAKTSSFLAFERTQYYMYELLHDGSSAQSPSAACPVAIVSFSYTDTKATLVAPQEKSEENKLVCHYFPWRGRLEIGTHFYDVGLRSTAGASISAELPPVVKVDRAISMLDLRQLLPKAVFETCFSGEVSLEGLYCTLCELVPSEVEENSSFSLLLWEIREKDVALTVPLNDGGFLILLHSSHFLTYDDTGSSAPEVLQGMFVFPDSRVIYRDTKFVQKKPVISSEILRVLPVLSYAEGEVEKAPNDPSEELCEVFVQHMQSYAALINPGLALSPSRDVSIFPDQYDVPDDHKHLYSTPEWTNRAWQNFRSYLSKPVSFQLPLSKASEILAAGQEERIEDLDDDVYFCLSSPEEAPVNHVSMGSEDQLTGQKSAVNVETPVDNCITSGEAQVDLTGVPQNVSPDDLQAGDATKDNERSDLTVLIKTDNMGTKNLLIPSTSDDLPAELIVSITSAEPTVTDASFSGSTESTTKLNDFQRSGFSTSKLQTAEMNSLDDETVKTKKLHDCPEVNNVTKTKRRKRRGRSKGWKKVPKACIETPGLQTVKIPVEDDNLKSQKEDQAQESSSHPQLSNPPNIDWRKGPRQKRKYGKLSSQNTKLRSASVGLAVMEKKKSSPGQQSFGSTILMELESFPLRRKTERWDLKPVISECGRILVPHGSVDMADQIKSLKDKLQSTKNEQSSEKMLVDASVNARDEVEMEQEASTALETAVDETEATASNDGGNNLQNVIVNHLDSEHSILRSSDDGSGSLTLNPKSSEHFSKNDDTDTPSLKAVQEKHTDTPSPAATKSEFLLSKLKSVLLRGKRKTVIPVSAERTAETAQDTEPCLKKGKVDADSGMLKSNDAITSVQDTNLGVKEVSKMVSVDPVFAYALGLTPKETPDNKIEKSKGQDTQQKQDSSEKQEQTIPDKQPQIIQRPLSIFPRRSRIKTLKKHQGVSAEHVKKKWWLHFQTPACYASEKYKECTRDNTVRKTVKEKSSSACSSTDALTLLADLALSVSNDQVPPHPDPALERKPETSLKKCDLTKDEQESVLHALLRQPAARSIQPLECPSPSHLVRGSELVGLVSKEHDYSLPPSSSLLLGLSGTPFQVSPLSGSTRLLHHHQTMYGDGIKILHRSVKDEDRSEHNHRTPEYLKKQMGCRRKFRNFRTFVKKEGSIQVTKEWKENYDFNLDSKFTSDSKDRAIIRALHGPWDFSIQDTSEEVRLIVHMWIGLFYSRSTARFFHVDSDCSNPCSEKSGSLEMSSGMESAPAQSEVKAISFALFPNVTDTSDTSKALDLSIKENSFLDQGSLILDLSLKNSNAENFTSDPQVIEKETSVSGEQKEATETLKTVKPSMGRRKWGRKSVHSTEIINEVNDVMGTNESKRTCTPLQKPGRMEHTDVPSFKCGGTVISVQEEIENVSIQPEIHQTASVIGHVLHGCHNKKTDMKDGIENSEATKMSTGLVQKQGMDSSKSAMEKEVDSNKKAGDVHTIEHDKIESEDGENCEVKEKPYQEGNVELSPKLIHTGDDSTKEESGIVCNGNLLENEKQLTRKEPKAVSSGKTENVPVHEDKMIEDDHFGKLDGLDHKDRFNPVLEADSDLNDQPIPMICDGPDLAKKDRITECNGQSSLDEHPRQTDIEEDACHDLQLRKLCANVNALPDEHAISVKALSEMKPNNNEPAAEETSENDGCLADFSDQSLPMMCDGPDSVKDCVTECNRQVAMDEQPPQADIGEDACHDLQLRKLCANGNALKDAHANSEIAPHNPLEMEHIHNEPTVKESSENYICLANLSDQPLPMMCDGQDLAKKDYITEFNLQAPLVEQPPQADNKKGACHDLQLRKLCADGSELTEEHAISDKTPHGSSEMEPIYNEPAVEQNSENGICLADLSDQTLPVMCDGPESVQNDCITECNRQAALDDQPSQADKKKGACHDLQSRKLFTEVSALTEEHAISDKIPHGPSEMEPIHNEPAVVENSENVTCLANLSDQPLPVMYDGPDSVQKDCITECNLQAPLDEQPPQADKGEDARHALQSRKLCANGSALTDERAISVKAPHAPSEMGPIHNEPVIEETSENDVCLADLSDQPLPMMCDGLDSVQKDGTIKECNRQAPLDEQPPQADIEDYKCHDMQLRKLCANGSALTDEHAISEKAPHTLSEMEPIYNEPAVEETSENDRCLADLSDQPLPMMFDGQDSVKDSVTECNRQVPLDEQPPQADIEEDVCHDLQLRKLCANGSTLTDGHAISEKAPHNLSEMEPIYNEPVVEEMSENYICLADKALPVSDESPCSLDGSFADGSIPQTNDSVETGIQNKIMGKVNLSSDEHEDWDTKSVKGEQNTTQKELFHHHSHSTWFEAVTRCEAEVALTKETDLNGDNTNKGFENTHSQVVIPFIGIDTSREDVLQPHDLHSEGKLEEVQGQKEIPFISDTTYPETILSTEACSTSQMYSKKAELSARKILSLIETSKTNQTEVSESESDDRCPTPTMDEKPYQNATSSCSVPSSRSSTSAFSASVTCKNMTLKCLSRSSTLTKDKMPLEQKDKSTVNSGPNPHHVLHPDLELRTLRVLQSIKFFSKSSQNDKSSQIKTVDMKHSLDQTPHTSSKYIPTYLGSSHTSAGLQDKKINSTKPAVMPTSTSQELHTESSDHFLISPFKSKLDEILGVKLQLKKTDSSEHQRYFDKMDKLQETSVGQDYCHPQRSFASSECLQAIKPITDQDEHKTTSQTNLSHEPRSYSQRPVMAVKPSKSDEIQADYICKDREIENSVMSFFSKNKQTKPPVVTYTPASMLLEKKTEGLKGNSAGVNDYRQEASELSSTSSWLSNSDSNSDLDKAKCALLDSLYLYEVRNISSFNKMPSSFTVQSSESGKTSSKLVDGNQSFLTNSSVENIEQTTKESFEIDQKHCAHASTSFVDYKNESLIDDSLSLGPQSSLMCTVYNTSQKRCKSFLEQISQRCLQDDLTQASMEQECLIFSEQMKQLLKRSNRGPINQRDAHDKLNLSCSSPVTVHFSSLEEQEDSVDHLDAWPLVGQKIKVDMSDRKDLAYTTEEEKTLHLQGIGNPMEHAGVSSVTADCARLYTAMMNDVCAVKKVPSRPKHFRMDRGYTKTEPSNHFDFCDQMKREMDESFRSNLNSVVKKFCKTKYRFYMLVTSDGAFFKETKAHLEAEGHTAVQPSEFFLGEDSSSSLLIILRNEDIAEHICEVPHLIELKKSPDVQFAGIDEPDDVVNLTHQELFMRGGFIMFDRAALESLSLSDMKQMSEILQELSRKGKWKWMLHYRDSRRLKENARLSAEAKEKKHFLNWCQEFGLLEVLPYHECDLASKDQPDYLTCLVRLQVQNISARYPVFITETTTESTFETNGILTMTFNSFLTCSPSETFTVK